MLSPTLRERLRARLLRRQQELMRVRADQLAVSAELHADREPDWLDHAADQREARTLEHLSDTELVELHAIQSAMKRLEEGGYGRCVSCREDIDERRLDAVPHAAECFGCATVHGGRSAAQLHA